MLPILELKKYRILSPSFSKTPFKDFKIFMQNNIRKNVTICVLLKRYVFTFKLFGWSNKLYRSYLGCFKLEFYKKNRTNY